MNVFDRSNLDSSSHKRKKVIDNATYSTKCIAALTTCSIKLILCKLSILKFNLNGILFKNFFDFYLLRDVL